MFIRKHLAIIDGPNLLGRPAGFSIILVEHERAARLLNPQSHQTTFHTSGDGSLLEDGSCV